MCTLFATKILQQGWAIGSRQQAAAQEINVLFFFTLGNLAQLFKLQSKVELSLRKND
jgi:hypothetical protein